MGIRIGEERGHLRWWEDCKKKHQFFLLTLQQSDVRQQTWRVFKWIHNFPLMIFQMIHMPSAYICGITKDAPPLLFDFTFILFYNNNREIAICLKVWWGKENLLEISKSEIENRWGSYFLFNSLFDLNNWTIPCRPLPACGIKRNRVL